MFVNKIGRIHLEYGKNCQDYGMAAEKIRMVCDGCSEGAHTEVGVKVFVHLTRQGFGVEEAFEKLMELLGQSTEAVRDFLCFTMIRVEEEKDAHQVYFWGDGYVILEDTEGTVTFRELKGGVYPEYYAYNYVAPDRLKYYKDGVKIKELTFGKDRYRRVGAATDGLRYLIQGEQKLLDEFTAALRLDQEVKVKRLINRYRTLFKDDLTIAW